jgi:hypothetical protein
VARSHRGRFPELELYFQGSLNSVIGRVQWEFPAFVSQARKFAGLLLSERV